MKAKKEDGSWEDPPTCRCQGPFWRLISRAKDFKTLDFNDYL